LTGKVILVAMLILVGIGITGGLAYLLICAEFANIIVNIALKTTARALLITIIAAAT
jgi:hypothetical protein